MRDKAKKLYFDLLVFIQFLYIVHRKNTIVLFLLLYFIFVLQTA